jgi:hypothetical protein
MCPICDQQLRKTTADNWQCREHGNFNTSCLVEILHNRHSGPFHIVLSTEQMDRLLNEAHIGIVDEILTIAQRQGYLTPKDKKEMGL